MIFLTCQTKSGLASLDPTSRLVLESLIDLAFISSLKWFLRRISASKFCGLPIVYMYPFFSCASDLNPVHFFHICSSYLAPIFEKLILNFESFWFLLPTKKQTQYF